MGRIRLVNTTEHFVLDGKHGPIHGLLDLPSRPGPHPAIVAIHGFKGFMEWGFFPPLAELLCERGYAVFRCNLSGSGMRPGDELASDLDGFRANSHLREVADVECILDSVGEQIASGQIDKSRIGLLGHSRGGGAVLLAASRSPWRERLRALVTWAAVASFDRYTEEQKALWREQGELIVLNGRTGQEMPLGIGLLEEMEAHSEELNIPAAAVHRMAPWLIVHGTEDEAVAVNEAHELAEAGSGTVELEILEGSGHTFGAKHPFAGPTPDLTRVFNLTQGWFRKYL